MEDKFTLIAKSRIIGRMQNQIHSRSYTSQFLVFVKKNRKANEFNYLQLLNA